MMGASSVNSSFSGCGSHSFSIITSTQSQMLQFCRDGNVEMLKKLSQKFVLNFEETDSTHGYCSFHYASLYGHVDALRFLSDKLDINIQTVVEGKKIKNIKKIKKNKKKLKKLKKKSKIKKKN